MKEQKNLYLKTFDFNLKVFFPLRIIYQNYEADSFDSSPEQPDNVDERPGQDSEFFNNLGVHSQAAPQNINDQMAKLQKLKNWIATYYNGDDVNAKNDSAADDTRDVELLTNKFFKIAPEVKLITTQTEQAMVRMTDPRQILTEQKEELIEKEILLQIQELVKKLDHFENIPFLDFTLLPQKDTVEYCRNLYQKLAEQGQKLKIKIVKALYLSHCKDDQNSKAGGVEGWINARKTQSIWEGFFPDFLNSVTKGGIEGYRMCAKFLKFGAIHGQREDIFKKTLAEIWQWLDLVFQKKPSDARSRELTTIALKLFKEIQAGGDMAKFDQKVAQLVKLVRIVFQQPEGKSANVDFLGEQLRTYLAENNFGTFDRGKLKSFINSINDHFNLPESKRFSEDQITKLDDLLEAFFETKFIGDPFFTELQIAVQSLESALQADRVNLLGQFVAEQIDTELDWGPFAVFFHQDKALPQLAGDAFDFFNQYVERVNPFEKNNCWQFPPQIFNVQGGSQELSLNKYLWPRDLPGMTDLITDPQGEYLGVKLLSAPFSEIIRFFQDKLLSEHFLPVFFDQLPRLANFNADYCQKVKAELQKVLRVLLPQGFKAAVRNGESSKTANAKFKKYRQLIENLEVSVDAENITVRGGDLKLMDWKVNIDYLKRLQRLKNILGSCSGQVELSSDRKTLNVKTKHYYRKFEIDKPEIESNLHEFVDMVGLVEEKIEEIKGIYQQVLQNWVTNPEFQNLVKTSIIGQYSQKDLQKSFSELPLRSHIAGKLSLRQVVSRLHRSTLEQLKTANVFDALSGMFAWEEFSHKAEINRLRSLILPDSDLPFVDTESFFDIVKQTVEVVRGQK